MIKVNELNCRKYVNEWLEWFVFVIGHSYFVLLLIIIFSFSELITGMPASSFQNVDFNKDVSFIYTIFLKQYDQRLNSSF